MKLMKRPVLSNGFKAHGFRAHGVKALGILALVGLAACGGGAPGNEYLLVAVGCFDRLINRPFNGRWW